MDDEKGKYNSAYNEGYGQAKADLTIRIKEAYRLIHNEIAGVDLMGATASDKERNVLLERRKALQWVRSMLASVKSPRKKSSNNKQ